MARMMSLSERLSIALTTISSETEMDGVYALTYKVGARAREMEMEGFYEDLKGQNLSQLEGAGETEYSREDVKSGKELARLLEQNVHLPIDDEGKRFGAKYKRARRVEFNLLREFYKGE